MLPFLTPLSFWIAQALQPTQTALHDKMRRWKSMFATHKERRSVYKHRAHRRKPTILGILGIRLFSI